MDDERKRILDYIKTACELGRIDDRVANEATVAYDKVRAASSRLLPGPHVSTGPEGQVLFVWRNEDHQLSLEVTGGCVALWTYVDRVTRDVHTRDWHLADDFGPEVGGTIYMHFLGGGVR